MRKAAGARNYDYFRRALDEREAHPRDDMLTSLLRAEIDGERLSRNEILDICFLLLLAGLDTVTSTLGCNMTYLASNPEQRRRLIAGPEADPRRGRGAAALGDAGGGGAARGQAQT